MSKVRFGRWVCHDKVVQRDKNSNVSLKCRCECGTVRVVKRNRLRIGQSKSCGCLSQELARKRMRSVAKTLSLRHGHARAGKYSPEYTAYHHAKGRCENPKTKNYADYGGRGIKFLFDSFEEFYAALGPRPKGMVLDRRDNDGNYSAWNCRWVTRKISKLNQRHANGNFNRGQFWHDLLVCLDLDPKVCYGNGLFGKENYSLSASEFFPPCEERVHQEVA